VLSPLTGFQDKVPLGVNDVFRSFGELKEIVTSDDFLGRTEVAKYAERPSGCGHANPFSIDANSLTHKCYTVALLDFSYVW
jgi:hypothetical protein